MGESTALKDLELESKTFVNYLEEARKKTKNDWERSFVFGMIDRYKKYQEEVLLSSKQIRKLKSIACVQ